MNKAYSSITLPTILISAGLIGANSGHAALSDDLVGHYRFDSAYTDSSGRGNHGTGVGSPGFAGGLIGSGSLHFSSAADGSFFNYVTLGTVSDFSFGAGTDFTTALWVRMDSWTGDPSFISNKDWNSGSNIGYVLASHTDGRFQWNYREMTPNTRKDYDGPAGVFTAGGGWHHLAVSWDRGGNANAFVDGVLVDTRTILGPDPSSTTIDSGLATNIGQDGVGTYTDGGTVAGDGNIDDVGIWRRVLTDTEIATIYANGLAGVAIPEPGTWALLGLGSLLMIHRLRRSR